MSALIPAADLSTWLLTQPASCWCRRPRQPLLPQWSGQPLGRQPCLPGWPEEPVCAPCAGAGSERAPEQGGVSVGARGRAGRRAGSPRGAVLRPFCCCVAGTLHCCSAAGGQPEPARVWRCWSGLRCPASGRWRSGAAAKAPGTGCRCQARSSGAGCPEQADVTRRGPRCSSPRCNSPRCSSRGAAAAAHPPRLRSSAAGACRGQRPGWGVRSPGTASARCSCRWSAPSSSCSCCWGQLWGRHRARLQWLRGCPLGSRPAQPHPSGGPQRERPAGARQRSAGCQHGGRPHGLLCGTWRLSEDV